MIHTPTTTADSSKTSPGELVPHYSSAPFFLCVPPRTCCAGVRDRSQERRRPCVRFITQRTNSPPNSQPRRQSEFVVSVSRDPVTMASTDRDVLLVLYWSTGGARWNCNTNWGTDAALCNWHGVQVDHDGEGRVVMLALGSNNLQGIVRPTLQTVCSA